jgi:hypothetical protein
MGDTVSILDTNKAAAFLGKRPQTLRAWRVRGGGPPYIRTGKPLTGRVAYRLSDLEAWLSARCYASTAEETVLAGGGER